MHTQTSNASRAHLVRFDPGEDILHGFGTPLRSSISATPLSSRASVPCVNTESMLLKRPTCPRATSSSAITGPMTSSP